MNKIYIIICYGKGFKFIKLGYTSVSIKQRFRDFSYKYKVIRVVKNRKSKLIEESIHRLMYRHRFKFEDKFSGYTECYPVSCLNEIHSLINNFCKISPKKSKKNTIINKNNEVLNEYGQLDYVDLSMYKK